MLPEAYTRFRDELTGLLDQRFHTVSWLECQIVNGVIRVLGNDKAVILFDLKLYPTGWLELQGLAAAGDLETIKDELIPAAEELARSMGCKSARIESREAWVRLLPDYQQYQTAIIKEL